MSVAAPAVGAVATQNPNSSRFAMLQPCAHRTPTAGSSSSRASAAHARYSRSIGTRAGSATSSPPRPNQPATVRAGTPFAAACSARRRAANPAAVADMKRQGASGAPALARGLLFSWASGHRASADGPLASRGDPSRPRRLAAIPGGAGSHRREARCCRLGRRGARRPRRRRAPGGRGELGSTRAARARVCAPSIGRASGPGARIRDSGVGGRERRRWPGGGG